MAGGTIEALRLEVRRFFLRHLLRKYPTRAFGLSDPTNDFVTIDTIDADGSRMVAVAMEGDDVTFRRRNSEDLTTLPLTTSLAQRFTVVVYKGDLTARCDSLWEAYRFSYLGAGKRRLRRQSRFDRVLTEYRDRMEILEASMRLRDAAVSGENPRLDNPIRLEQLATELYGPLISTSARQFEYYDVLSLKLRSFVESGEIEIVVQTSRVDTFKVRPKAHETLARYALAERHHRDNVRVQWLLLVACVALTLLTILQLIRS